MAIVSDKTGYRPDHRGGDFGMAPRDRFGQPAKYERDKSSTLRKKGVLEDTGEKVCNLEFTILVVKITIILVCMGVTFWQTWVCLERYLKKDTSTILSVKPTGNETFLTWTVCPAFGSSYKEDVLAAYGTDRSAYADGDYSTPSAPDDLDPRKVYAEAVYSLEDVVELVEFQTSDEEDSEILAEIAMRNHSNKFSSWHAKYHIKYGTCFSLDVHEKLAQKGITQIVFVTKVNTFVFLHHPGQYMDVNSKTKIPGDLGERIYIDISYEMTSNTLEHEANIPCSSSMDRHFDDCLEQQVPELVYIRHGCVIPYFPAPAEYPACDWRNATLMRAAVEDYEFWMANGQHEICERPCDQMEVFTGLPFDGVMESGDAYAKVYLKSTVKSKQTILDYSFRSMIADIGGYTGLLLGVSFVHLTSLIDQFYLRIWS